MGQAQEKKIEQLEQELRVAQELLFLVLDEVGGPVSFDIDTAREKMKSDRFIDLNLSEDEKTWTLQVVSTSDQ